MSKRKILILSLMLILLSAIVIIRIKLTPSGQRTPSALNVIISKPEIGNISRYEILTGDILPSQQTYIYSKVNGNLEKVYVDIGDYVSSGQILALIDTTIYSQNLRQAKANLLQADFKFENDRKTFERNKFLFDQSLISRQELDNSKTLMDASYAGKEAAQAVCSNTQTQLSYCKIKAPFSGIITKRFFDPGAFITGSAGGPANSLFNLISNTELKSILNIPERLIPFISNIKEIEITADALPELKFRGKITRISNAVDVSTRTMAVEVRIISENKVLKPGMYASFKLILEKKQNVFILPTHVILNDDKGDFVYHVLPDTLVAKKYIKTGIKQDERVEILSGISDKDKIIVTGQNLVKEKVKVKLSRAEK